MNIYDLLRSLIEATAKTGQLNKKDIFDGLDLIKRLESVSAFGTIGSITSGHDYQRNGETQ